MNSNDLLGVWKFCKTAAPKCDISFNVSFTSDGKTFNKISVRDSFGYSLYYDDTLIANTTVAQKGSMSYFEFGNNIKYNTIDIIDVSKITDINLFYRWLNYAAIKEGTNIDFNEVSLLQINGETVKSIITANNEPLWTGDSLLKVDKPIYFLKDKDQFSIYDTKFPNNAKTKICDYSVVSMKNYSEVDSIKEPEIKYEFLDFVSELNENYLSDLFPQSSDILKYDLGITNPDVNTILISSLYVVYGFPTGTRDKLLESPETYMLSGISFKINMFSTEDIFPIVICKLRDGEYTYPPFIYDKNTKILSIYFDYYMAPDNYSDTIRFAIAYSPFKVKDVTAFENEDYIKYGM